MIGFLAIVSNLESQLLFLSSILINCEISIRLLAGSTRLGIKKA